MKVLSEMGGGGEGGGGDTGPRDNKKNNPNPRDTGVAF